MEIRNVKLSEIKANTENPRYIKDEAYKKLVQSIKDFPEMREAREIVVNKDMVILGGNMRFRAMQEAGVKETTVKIVDWDEKKQKEFIIKDNVESGDWEWDKLANEWEQDKLEEWGMTIEWDIKNNQEKSNGKKLTEVFIIPPFSIFDTKQGYWQERKRSWLSIGIQSEKGRQGVETYSYSANPNFYYKKEEYEKKNNIKLSAKQFKDIYLSENKTNLGVTDDGGTISVFDPVLCEISYRWFNIKNGSVLDPFAGGSVRGVVAEKLGYKYTGIELSQEQVEANREQSEEMGLYPIWINGDSNIELDKLTEQYDMIFSCPPYEDLEVYSDNPLDISNMNHQQFNKIYKSIINKAVSKLKDNRFIVWVVSEVRNKSGVYNLLVPNTINYFEEAGVNFYNEIILANTIGSTAMRVLGQFPVGRKVGRIHQNVLVFYKGDPKMIKEHYEKIDLSGVEEVMQNEILSE